MNVEQFNLLLITSVKSRDYGEVYKLLLQYPKFLVSIYPLIAAIEEDNSEMIQLLLSDKRFINDYVLSGALASAIETRNIFAISIILSKIEKLSVDFLYQAVKTGSLEIVELFTSDMRIPTESFYECANIATEMGNTDMLNYFYGFWNTEYIIEKNRIQDITQLTNNGYSLNDIMTAACKKGKIKMIKFLYSQGVIPTHDDCLDAKKCGHDKVARQIYNILCQELSKLRKQL